MKISNETKVGILAVFALVILILGYQYLQGKRVFAKTTMYHASYSRVSGLSGSDDVIFRGLAIGQISDINFNDKKDSLVVTFILEEDIEIPKGSEARIVNADLLGAKALEIIFSDSPEIIKEGGALRGTVEQSLSQQIEEQLVPVKNKIEVMLSSIDSVITRINGIFDVRLQGKIDENIISIEAAIRNIRDITANISALVASTTDNADTIMANLAAITTTFKDNREELDRTFKNLAAITDTLARANLAKTISDIDALVANLDAVAQKLNEGDGSVAQLINNEELYKQLEKSAKNLNLLLEEIRKKPGAYAPALIRIGVK